MRFMYLMICAVLVVSLTGLTRADVTNSGDDAMQKLDSAIGTASDRISEAAEKMEQMSADQLEAASKKFRTRIDNLKGKIAQLRTNADQLQGDAKAKMQKMAAGLKAKLRESELEFGNLQKSTDAAWYQARDKLKASLQKLEDAYGEAVDKIKKARADRTDSGVDVDANAN